MTFEQVITALQDAATNVNPNGTFMYGKRPDAGLTTTSTALPIIWLAPFREMTDRNRGTIERQVVLAFFEQDSPNKTDAERQQMIENMWELQNDFMNYLQNAIPKTFSITNEVQMPEYYKLAGTVSGYSVTFKFQSKLPC